MRNCFKKPLIPVLKVNLGILLQAIFINYLMIQLRLDDLILKANFK